MAEFGEYRVAVLLAAYNGAEWITEQIESIQSQKNININLFVSVDLSSDSTVQIVRSLQSRFENITLLEYGERFGSAAPNFFHLLRTLSVDEYDYVALSDQDDIWLPEKLNRAIRVIQAAKCDGFSSDIVAFWPDGREKMIKKSYPQKKYDFYFEGPGPGCTFVLSSLLTRAIRTELLELGEASKLIDWHDWFIYSYARHLGYRWVIDPCPLLRYRQHEYNQLGANSGLKSLLNRVKAVTSGYALDQARWNVRNLHIQNEFVSKWKNSSRMNLVRLAVHSRQCRRKILDQFVFFFSCFIMIFFLKRNAQK